MESKYPAGPADRLLKIAAELAEIAESFRVDEANRSPPTNGCASDAWWNLQNAVSRIMHASICSRQINEPQCYSEPSKEQA